MATNRNMTGGLLRSSGLLALALAMTASATAAADGPNAFVFGGPSVAAADTALTPAPDTCRLCSRSAQGGEGPSSREAAPLLMLGAGLVGTEGRLRGGAEVVSIFSLGRTAAGYSAIVTYGGVDFDRAFVQTGLGVGSYWGAHSGDERLERVAGIAHLELGLRVVDGFSVLARGDFLLGREEQNAVGTIGLQWVPAVFGRLL